MVQYGAIHLLDSAQGHPLQTWKIETREQVTIGRSDENDIVLADPYVSRAHAYLEFDSQREEWRLVSISRHQLTYQDETRSQLTLSHGMIFRLGQHGCFLRFDQMPLEDEAGKTMSFDANVIPVFALDKQKLQREVTEITEGDYFQHLKKTASALRQRR